MRMVLFATAAALVFAAPAFAQSTTPALAGETEVDPYTISDANAGASPVDGKALFAAFHGHEGIGRIVDDLVAQVQKDPRLSDIFHASDFVRLSRTLKEQFCYILNGGCSYTGRDMKSVHADHGITTAEFNALVEVLQAAMAREGVAFAAQNRLLAKLAPMKHEAVTR
jgi:hemoglobin